MARSACLRVGAGVVWAQIAWSALAQTTYYVDASCGNDAWAGTSPVCVAPNGPKRTIQAGIDASVTADTVIVADGTYTGFGNRDLDFGGRDIHLRSESLDPTLCIIDCQGSANDPHRGFYFHSGETSAAIVEGFTIRGGYSDIHGGAALCEASNPTFRGCAITNNTANITGGGGIACINSGATIESCTFTNNTGRSISSRGGAVYTDINSNALIRDCLFTGNDAGLGGAIFMVDSMILNCIVSDNTSGFDAGGIQCFSTPGGSSLIEGCTITRNTSPARNGGAGIQVIGDGAATIADCIIADNVSTFGQAGGIAILSGGNVLIRDCDVLRNSAPAGVGGIFNRSATLIITRCRVRDNVSTVGGIWITVSTTILDCQITGNRAIGNNARGGGINKGGRGACTIENCLITGNSSDQFGGGIGADDGTEIVNCVIAGNDAGLDGGGVWCRRRVAIENCTIAANTAGFHGGGLAVIGTEAPCCQTNVLMDNCVLWENSAAAGSQIALLDFDGGGGRPYPGDIEVAHCDVQGGQSAVHVDPASTLNWLAGNINVDPLFVDPVNADYHISPGSPCIDSGDPAFVPMPGQTDFDHELRVWDGDGNGTATVDMGADEFGSYVFGDLNCDGAFNGADIDPFFLALGDPAAYAAQFPVCNALLGDLNADGRLDGADIDPFFQCLGGNCP